MADSIVRLRLDNKEYDQNIKAARDGMLALEQAVRKGDGSFIHIEKSTVDYVKAIGEMETKSRGVKGQIAELTRTFVDLSGIYNKMTAEEKADPVGKAMAESLSKLKVRIDENKVSLDSINAELGKTGNAGSQTGGIMDQLASKFTINIDALELFKLGLNAAKGALDVAKDAFFKNEETLDEWGRSVQSAESVYSGFLSALNTGDISSFLSNIDNIVKAARDAYDALDALSTYNAFNQVNVERTRTNMTESIADYRSGSGNKETVRAAGEAYKKELQDRQRMEREAYLAYIAEVAAQRGVSEADLRKAMSGTYGNYQQLKSVMPSQQQSTIVGGPGQQTRIETSYVPANESERLGQALRQLNDTELQNLQALGAQAERTGNEIASVDRQLARVLNGRTGGGGASSTTKSKTKTDPIAELTKEYQSLAQVSKSATGEELVRADDRMKAIREEIAVLQRRNDELKRWADEAAGKRAPVDPTHIAAGDPTKAGYKALPLYDAEGAASGMSMAIVEKLKSSYQSQLANADFGSPFFERMKESLKDSSILSSVMELAVKRGIDMSNIDFTKFGKLIGEGIDIPDSAWTDLERSINEQLTKLNIDPVKIDLQTGGISKMKKDSKNMKQEWNAAASAISSVGQAMSKIEDPAAKVVGTIAQAIASIALGAGQAIAQAGNGSAGGPWGWIAFAAAATATMVSTIASVKSATAGSFESGGVVPGNSYHGDHLTAQVNSGEVILSMSQQRNLLANISERGNTLDNLNLSAVISGEQIRLVLNNHGRRTGRGEYVTAKFS